MKHLPHRVVGIILLHVNREAHNDNIDHLGMKLGCMSRRKMEKFKTVCALMCTPKTGTVKISETQIKT